jgi:FkbM family methyltransferase
LIDCGAAEVYAFEPVPSTFELLRANLRPGSSYHAIHSAVGEYDGEVEIELPLGEKSELASRDLKTTDVPDAPVERSRVPIVTVDRFCAERGLHFDFVKIDVEGFEMEVLTGAQQTLASEFAPAIIQFEINTHHRRRRQTVGDFELLLRGYTLFRLAEHALRPIDSQHYLANIYALQNIVAIRRNDERVRGLFVE